MDTEALLCPFKETWEIIDEGIEPFGEIPPIHLPQNLDNICLKEMCPAYSQCCKFIDSYIKLKKLIELDRRRRQ